MNLIGRLKELWKRPEPASALDAYEAWNALPKLLAFIEAHDKYWDITDDSTIFHEPAAREALFAARKALEVSE